MIGRQQIKDATVLVSVAVTYNDPGLRRPRAELQGNRNSRGGLPSADVQNMRGNVFHSLNNFLNRKRVIKRCSSAAFRISTDGSLPTRRRSIASIPAAVWPVAQTMN